MQHLKACLTLRLTVNTASVTDWPADRPCSHGTDVHCWRGWRSSSDSAACCPGTEFSWWIPSGFASHCLTEPPPKILEKRISKRTHKEKKKSEYAHLYISITVLHTKWMEMYAQAHLHRYKSMSHHLPTYKVVDISLQKHTEDIAEYHMTTTMQTKQTIHTLALKTDTHTFLNWWSPPIYSIFTWLFFYLDLNCQIEHSEVQHTCGYTKKARYNNGDHLCVCVCV